jgi:hypothetical protein
MKNNSLKQMSVTALTILMIAGSATLAAAAKPKILPAISNPLIARCGLRSVIGNYGLSVTSTILVPPSSSILVASGGIVNFDGEGSLTGTSTTSFGGNVSTDAITGAYTVESNCTGTFSVTFSNGFTINHNFVLVDEGREMLFVQTDPGNITTGHARRQ